MGIQYLNSYIKNNVSNNSIQKISLFNLYNKIISVDISIYLYKFMNDGDLIENFYNMLCIFHYYNIYPIFVFDGKPPPEKNYLIERRKNEKNIAKIKFDKLKDKLNNNEIKETNEIYEIKNIMDSLKKKFNKINNNDIDDIKKLISAFNYIYIQAESEADNICAKLVENNIAYACLSEDMDMFLYGCKRVLRYFSLTNHCAIIYNLYDIFNDISMPFHLPYHTIKKFRLYRKEDSDLWLNIPEIQFWVNGVNVARPSYVSISSSFSIDATHDVVNINNNELGTVGGGFLHSAAYVYAGNWLEFEFNESYNMNLFD